MKKLILFLSLFVFIMFPKIVFALPSDSGVIEFKVNNVEFVSTNNSLTLSNNSVYNLLTEINTSNVYNYYVIYFYAPQVSYDGTSRFGVNVSGGCTYSCFSSNSYVKPIGIINNNSYYAIVLPLGKVNCGVGTGQCLIDNNVLLYTIENMNITIVGVDAMNDDTILNNNYAGFLDVIRNQNNNSQSIINNQNSNTQTIINNQTSNTQSIINNDNANQAQSHQDMQDINNSLNNDEAPSSSDVSGKASEWASKSLSDGVVSNMVLMPITLLNSFVNGFSSSCQPYNLGSLYGTNLTLPCINISNYIGSNLWNVIDVLFSGFMIYAIGKKFVKIFNDFTNLRDNQVDELYGGGN